MHIFVYFFFHFGESKKQKTLYPFWEKSDFKKSALSNFGQSQIFKSQRFSVLGKAKF